VCLVSELVIAPTYLDEALTTLTKSLPTANSLPELDKSFIDNSPSFVCDFVRQYFTAVGSRLRLPSAYRLMIELFRLDALWEFDSTVANHIRVAWQQALTVACSVADPELGHVDEMLSIVIDSIGKVDSVGRLSVVVSQLWRTATVAASRPLDLRVLTEALSSGRSTLLRSPSLLARVLDHSLVVDSVDGFQLSMSTETLHDTRAMAMAALTARFLLASWKTSSPCGAQMDAASAAGEDDSDEMVVATGNDNNNLYIEMLVDIAVAVVSVQASQVYVNRQPVLRQELQQDFYDVIGRLSETEVETVIGRVLDWSVTDGGVWSLVLDVILRRLELCNKEVVGRSLPSDLDQFVPLTPSIVSTLCAIMPRMSRDFQRHITEITVALLITCDVDKIASFDGEHLSHII